MGAFDRGAAVGGALGGIFSGAGSLASSFLSFNQQKEMQQRQFDFQRDMSNNAFSRLYKNIRSTGINPMVSVMGNPQQASTPSEGMSAINTPDYGASIANGIATATQVKRINAEAKFLNEQAKTEEKKRQNFEADTGLKEVTKANWQIQNSQLPERLKKEMEQITTQTYLNRVIATATQMDSITKRIEAETNKMNAQTNRYNANTNKYNAETNRLKGKEEAKYTAERNRGGGWIESLFEGVKNTANDRGWKTNRNPIIHR